MEETIETSQSAKVLAELYNIAKELSEDEQLYLLNTVKALKQRLKRDKNGEFQHIYLYNSTVNELYRQVTQNMNYYEIG